MNDAGEANTYAAIAAAGITMGIENLVNDWGGFEKLVAELHQTGEVTVEHDVTLTGKSGAPRQIDVLIRHKQGLYEHLIVVECKYWNSPIERLHVDALLTTMQEVGASRGVIFSTKGFQSGAVTQAEYEKKIDLFVIRELTDAEWGLPGRVVDIFLQVVSRSIGNLALPEAGKFGSRPSDTPILLNLVVGADGPVSVTPTVMQDGSEGDSVEKQILAGVEKVQQQRFREGFTVNDGAEGTYHMVASTVLNFTPPLMVPVQGETVVIPRVTFDLAFRIHQTRPTVDRARNFKFAVAIQNCITGEKMSASRRIGGARTVLAEIAPAVSTSDIVVNGQVVRAFTKGFFPFEEMRR